MLLRNRRSRAMNKPNLISDHHHHHQNNNNSQSSPKPNHDDDARTTIPSLFCSLPKLRDFTMKCLSSGIEALPSPTSILDTRTVLSPLRDNIPFSYENNISPRILHSSNNKNKTMNCSKEGIGLALVGTLKDDDPIHHHHHHENSGNNNNNNNNNNILFGTQLRVKTNNNNNSSSSNKGCCCSCSCCCCCSESSSSFVMMNLSEMELSEEYTCVITHNGPNPRKTHIFVDNCIVETYFYSSSSSSSIASLNNFLSFCYTCKKHLEHTKDIFIYRGDKAFCSEECRHKEMVLDGAAENS